MRLSAILLGCVVALGAAPASHAGTSLDTPIPDPVYVGMMAGATLLALSPDGALYSLNTNKISRWIPGENRFDDIVTALPSLLGISAIEPSGFTMLTPDVAVVLTGASDTVALVNVNTSAVDVLTSAGVSGNFGAATDPVSGNLFITSSSGKAYMLDLASEGAATELYDHPGSAYLGTGLAFDPAGNLYIPVPTGISNFPFDDDFPVDLVRISAGYIADFVAGQPLDPNDINVLMSGAEVSGSASVAIDNSGQVYVAAADAIYRIDPVSQQVTTQEGDASQNVFSSSFAVSGTSHMGLVYDSVNMRLLYGQGTGYPPENLTLMESIVAMVGDTDRDGDVDGADLAALGLNWAPGGSGGTWETGDFDGDGDIDGTDLAALGLNWSPGGVGAAPEPQALAMIAFGVAGILASRRLN